MTVYALEMREPDGAWELVSLYQTRESAVAAGLLRKLVNAEDISRVRKVPVHR